MSAINRTFRIFISSTFSDMKEERNALHKRVFPSLRDLCMAHGARFQVIDLQWGVSEEACQDQQTMKICQREIERCQRVSPNVNLIVLLGERYGWRPLPFEINADEFHQIEEQVAEGRDRDLLLNWYKRDDNAVPAVYILQPRADSRYKDYACWEKEVQAPLNTIFEKALTQMELTEEQQSKYNASATAQELKHGFGAMNAHKNVLCFFRQITNLNDLYEDIGKSNKENAARFYIDLDQAGNPDRSAHGKLLDLKQMLRKLIPENCFEYNASWSDGKLTTDHLDLLCMDLKERLTKMILSEISRFEAFEPLQREIDEHARFCRERTKFFTGRSDICRTIADYVKSDDRHLLAVYGNPGSGKSSLMGRAVEKALEENPQAVLVYRFLGATPDSSNGRTLLESLSRQICRAYNIDEINVPSEYNQLTQYFLSLLSNASQGKPLILFLDALDQIRKRDRAHELAWLPSKLSKNVKLIASTTPGDCLDVLRDRLPPANLIELKAMTRDDGYELLRLWLEDAHRKLQQDQQSDLLEKFANSGLPLYLKLAFEEARNWRSYDGLPAYSGNIRGVDLDIHGVIRNNLFWRLMQEANHGKCMVERSMTYISAAKNGLTEGELNELLSRDQIVMADFHRRSPKSPQINILPAVIWSRLYFDLEPYLMERNADGTSTLSFYHRQLNEVVEKDYLQGEAHRERHRHLASYFGSLPTYYIRNDRKMANMRKLSEYPYQQAQGEMETELKATLSCFEFINAKINAMGPQDMISDYDFISIDKDLRTIQESLRLSSHILSHDPGQVRGQLLGRLIGQSSPLIQSLLNEAQEMKTGQWLRPLTSSLTSPIGPLIRTLQGHTESVTAVSITNDGRKAISGSKDSNLIFWDLETGEALKTLRGHSGPIWSVAMTPDGKTAISGSSDSTLIVWDLETGNKDRTLEGHTDSVRSVAVTPDGGKAVSVSRDNTLRVWDLKNREAGEVQKCNDPLAIAITFDGKRAVSGSSKKNLTVWNLETGRVLGTPQGHTDAIWEVAITPGDTKAVSASLDNTLKVWRLDTEYIFSWNEIPGKDNSRLIRFLAQKFGINWVKNAKIKKNNDKTIKVSTEKNYLSLNLNDTKTQVTIEIDDGETSEFLAEMENNDLNIYDTGEALRTLYGHIGPVLALAMDSDGKIAVSGSGDSTIKVWDLETGRMLSTLQGHTDWVNAVAITPDGKRAVSASDDNTIKVWNLEKRNDIRFPKGHDFAVNAIAISPDGRKAVSSSSDNTIKVWNLSTGEEIRTLRGHYFSKQRRLTLGWEGSKYPIRQVDFNWRFSLERKRMRKTGSVNAVAVTQDGWIVSGADDNTLKVWDMETGKEIRTLAGHRFWINAVAVIPDDKIAVSGSMSGALKVWDLRNGELIRTIKGHNSMVNAIAASRGWIAISGSLDNAIKVWDLNTGDEIRTLEGHEDAVTAVAVTPDGKLAVSGSWDNSLKVWDLKTGETLNTIRYHADSICAVALSSDGKIAVSGSANDEIRVFDLEAQMLRANFTCDGPITAVAIAQDRISINAGDILGHMHFLELDGI